MHLTTARRTALRTAILDDPVLVATPTGPDGDRKDH